MSLSCSPGDFFLAKLVFSLEPILIHAWEQDQDAIIAP
jgi:hypothetical protein